MRQYEDYWRGVVANEIESLKLPHTDRQDVLLGYAMAIADAANTARKWGAGNHLASLDEDEEGFTGNVTYPRWPEGGEQ